MVRADDVIEMAVQTVASGIPLVTKVDEDESAAQHRACPEVWVQGREGTCVGADDMDGVAAR